MIKERQRQLEAVLLQRGFRVDKGSGKSKGQKIFKRGSVYATIDIDGHKGGVFKLAICPKHFANSQLRMGTYDINLNKIGP